MTRQGLKCPCERRQRGMPCEFCDGTTDCPESQPIGNKDEDGTSLRARRRAARRAAMMPKANDA